MRSTRLLLFFSLVGLCLVLTSVFAAPRWDATFPGFLAAQDVVFEGAVVRVDSMTRQMLGSYDANSIDVTLRVTKVMAGIVEDSLVVVSSFGRRTTVRREIPPGSLVVVWGNRVAEDSWRLWGSWAGMTPEGRIVTAQDYEPPTIAEADLIAALAKRQPIGDVFQTGSALGIVRVGRITGDMYDGGLTVPCDSIGWAIGSADHLPDTLICRGLFECLAPFGSGDTILVPVPAAFAGGTYVLPACPRGVRIKRGFVPALAVPIGELSRTLERRGEGFAIKSTVVKPRR